MTLDLEPGNYFVLDDPQLPDPVIETFTVVEPQAYGPGRTPRAASSASARTW